MLYWISVSCIKNMNDNIDLPFFSLYLFYLLNIDINKLWTT